MKQLLWIEKNIEETIKKIKEPLQIGLIAGQLSLKQDFAIHFIRCPDKVEEDVTENDVTEDRQTFDPSWVLEHARQVGRMLPGGIYIIGIFLFSDSKFLAEQKLKIQKTLMVLQKNSEKNAFIQQSIPHKYRYFVSIDQLSKKLSCYSFDVSEKSMSFNPADLKFQSFIETFSCMTTTANLAVNVPVPIKEDIISFEKKILFAVRSEIDLIWNSYATVDCQLIDNDELIVDNTKSKKNRGKKKEQGGETIEVALFHKQDQGRDDIDMFTADITVKFTGKISSRAYIHSKGTYREVLNYLKVDIIKSLLTRVELLCEEAQVNNIIQVDEWSLVSPVRVFCKFKSPSVICFSDYVFKDETESDLLSRFEEILNVKLDLSRVEYVEHSPSVTEVTSMLDLPSDKQSDVNSDVASELSSSYQEEAGNKRMYFAGGLVAAIATMGYSFMKLIYSPE